MPIQNDFRISAPDQPTVLDIDAGAGDGTQTLAAGQRVGPYRIVRLLGEGGMGAVYLAEQLEPIERPVALKLIRGPLRGGMAEAYFLVERQALARMDHPAIAKVYDAGTTPQGQPFFAMEWIDGPSLAASTAARSLPLRDKLALFARICMGVQHAHQKGVIHRDLKPSNVLIAEVDGQPAPKIIDFGIAIGAGQASGGESTLRQRAGTRGYMSLEQLQGKLSEIDIRSDVYALGVMLLELLASPALLDRAAAQGLDNRDLHAALLASLGQHIDADAQSVRDLAAIPAPLRWLLAHAIDPERACRYASAQAVAEDIDRYLRRYPLHAVPSTPGYRLRCFAVRNRVQMIAAALIALALLAGTSAAVVGMLRAKVEAEKSRQTAQFLTDVLSGVDPEQARDLDKKLLHLVLDNAAARAGRELADQPEVLAHIESTIGGSYNALSEYKTSVEHLRRAFDLARTHLGSDTLLTLQIERQLARELLYIGKQKESDELIQHNIAAFTRMRGLADSQTLDSALDGVRNARERGDYAAAEKQIETLGPLVEKLDTNADKLKIDALELQAILLTDLGRYAEAEPIFRDVVERETRLWGAEYPRTIDSQNAFAIMYLESHRFAEGAKILQTMLPVAEKLYGPDHGVTINFVANLAGALRQQGTPEKVAESGPYYRRAFEAARKKYGEKHGNTAMATHNYANYLLDVGDTAQAIALQQQALAISTEVLGPDHAVTGEVHYGLAKALLRAQRYAEAESELLAAIAEKQKDLGADHWRMGEYLDKLIEAYTADGKADLAATWQAKRAALKPKPAAES